MLPLDGEVPERMPPSVDRTVPALVCVQATSDPSVAHCPPSLDQVPELMLSVYKTAACVKRLNAVSTKRISNVIVVPEPDKSRFELHVGPSFYLLEVWMR